jgi:tetratricopeptide (TPR) repeat protein
VILPDALNAYVKMNAGDLKGASALYGRATGYALKDLYVPVLYGCETVSSVFDLWSQLLNQLGEYRKNVREMPKAFTVDPDFVSLSYAHALSQVKRDGEALNQLDRYLTVNQNVASGYLEKGEILMLLTDTAGAVEAYRKSIELNPNDPRAHYGLGVALFQRNDKNGALEQFRITVRQGPDTQYGKQAQQILDNFNKSK